MTKPNTTPEPSETTGERSEASGTSRRTLLKGALASGTLALSPALAERVAASGDPTSVDFADQLSDGTSVVVDRVHLSEAGFISIHDGRFVGTDGEVGVGAGSIIGYSEFLEAGTHHDVGVALFEDEKLNLHPYDDRKLFDSQYLIVLPHADTNENGVWDFYPGEIQQDFGFEEGDTSSVFPLERTTDGAVIVSGHVNVDEDHEVPLAFDT